MRMRISFRVEQVIRIYHSMWEAPFLFESISKCRLCLHKCPANNIHQSPFHPWYTLSSSGGPQMNLVRLFLSLWHSMPLLNHSYKLWFNFGTVKTKQYWKSVNVTQRLLWHSIPFTLSSPPQGSRLHTSDGSFAEHTTYSVTVPMLSHCLVTSRLNSEHSYPSVPPLWRGGCLQGLQDWSLT